MRLENEVKSRDLLLLLLMGVEDKNRRGEDTNCVKSICTPLGVATNYCLISRTQAALRAHFHSTVRPNGTKTMASFIFTRDQLRRRREK